LKTQLIAGIENPQPMKPVGEEFAVRDVVAKLMRLRVWMKFHYREITMRGL